MKTRDSLALPPSPNLTTALRAGFDAITNHVVLILFPVALDLLLWLGPRLRLTQLIKSFVRQLVALYSLQDPGSAETLRSGQEVWNLVAEQFNLLGALRAYPVGIPSLMVSRFPQQTPVGQPILWEIQSLGVVLLAWALITVVGLMAGTYYFVVVCQASLAGQVNWRQALIRWPGAALQVFFLALLWAGLLVAASIPGSFIFSLVALGGFSLGQCVVILFTGFLIWLMLPLLFSTHGIFVNQHNMIASLKSSVLLTQRTLPTTFLFLMIVLLLSKGLDLLWLAPPETSWMTLVGVAGHAFITTGLLASSFIYYRDADRWVRSMILQKNLALR
ncbi:MAG TPA: hypothetical protein VGA03_02330 [Anaerolineales bacterium]